MSVIDSSIPLSGACPDILRRIVASLTDADLKELVATDPAFKNGGFRQTTKPAILRARVQQIVDGPTVISDAFRAVLNRRYKLCMLVGAISAGILCAMRAAFAACFGTDEILVAMLLDAREEVRMTACRWIHGKDSFDKEEPAAAASELVAIFAPIVNLAKTDPAIAEIAGIGAVPASAERLRTECENLETKLHDARLEIRRLHAVDDRMAGVQQKLKNAEGKLADVSAKLAAAESALRVERADAEALKIELGRETAHREARLQAAIDLALSKEFCGWLGEARAVESAARAPGAEADLLARADAALARQAEIDRASGNRLELVKRLDALEVSRGRVADALAHALRQSPELKAIDDALGQEILRLRALLGIAATPTPFESALVEAIHAADDNALPAYRNWPDPFLPLHLLDKEAVQRVRLAYQKRLAAVQAVGLPGPDKLEQEPKPVSRLSAALSRPTETILLCDGHNIIFGLPARYNPPRGRTATDAEKRQHFVQDVVRLVAASPALRAWIVFDGPTRSDTEAAPNVRVTYSGGTGEHRADGVLVDNVRFFKSAQPEVPVLLVSDDRELCSNARRLGAETLGVMELAGFFSAEPEARRRAGSANN